jgi:hypothetical protein
MFPSIGSGYGYEAEEDDGAAIDPSLLSNIAMRLRVAIPRSTHVKGSIPYPNAFSGQDIVVSLFFVFRALKVISCPQSTIKYVIRPHVFANYANASDTHIRRAALQVAHSLQIQRFFYEVEWSEQMVVDRAGDVYLFLDEDETPDDGTDIPTSFLTKCYSPSCLESSPRYAYSCPRKVPLYTPKFF